MTRKDYRLIAAALRESKAAVQPEHHGALIDVTERLVLALKADNPAFSEAVFRQAAGWE
jgi:hypothetical protein